MSKKVERKSVGEKVSRRRFLKAAAATVGVTAASVGVPAFLRHGSTATPYNLNLKWTCMGQGPPAKYTLSDLACNPWISAVQRLTDGRVTATVYGDQLLCKYSDAVDAVKAGICQMGLIHCGFTPGRFPSLSVFELPGLVPNQVVGNAAAYELSKEFPQIREEFEKYFKLLYNLVCSPNDLHTRTPIRSLKDLQGKIIGCRTPVHAEAIRAMGGGARNDERRRFLRICGEAFNRWNCCCIGYGYRAEDIRGTALPHRNSYSSRDFLDRNELGHFQKAYTT